MSLNKAELVSLRLVAADHGPGDEVHMLVPDLGAVGSTLGVMKLGGTMSFMFDSAAVTRECRPTTLVAMKWLLASCDVEDAAQELLLVWAGLESLCEESMRPWTCNKENCRAVVASCPACSAPTESHAVMRAVRDYLRSSIGVSGSQFSKQYALRSDIVHGRARHDHETLGNAARSLLVVKTWLLQAIKKEIGIPLDGPPLFHDNPAQGAMAATMIVSAKWFDEFYTRPAFFVRRPKEG